MKKYIKYIGVLVVGLILGWILFGASVSQVEHNHTETVDANGIWTCSMHPQVRQAEPGSCPICSMDLIPAETTSNGLESDEFKLTKNAMALANIQTSIVNNSIIENNRIKLSGKIMENEEANTVQVSYFSGRIEQLNINFTGEKVRKGQLLATIYSPELLAAQQELITASSLKKSQPALYNAVRNKLKLWKLSEKQINQIEMSKKVEENVPVYATVSGTVSEKLVEEGNYIREGQPLLKITNLNTVWASFDVYENQIDQFKRGQDISIITNAYPNKEFKSKISFVDPVLDIRTRTIKLRTVLDNKNDMFKPGMFVEAKVKGIVTESDNLLTIPASSILWTGERSVVYIKTNPNEIIFEMREVVLGNAIGENYEVLEGLNSGDEIVTNGAFTVDAAAQLQGKKSMMNKEGDRTTTGHEGHMQMNNDEMEKEMKNNSAINYSNPNGRVNISAAFQEQLKIVFENYIVLKDALIQSDSIQVKTSASLITENLDKMDIKLLSNSNTHNQWMKAENNIKMATQAIMKTDDLKQQRDHFISLSEGLTNAVKTFGINETIYHQFCPMADNNKGAYWLSKEKQILNPYFGSTMLTCGSVKEVINNHKS